MRAGRGKDLVAAASLLSAAILGGFLVLRSGGFFGVSWSDGARRFGSETGAAVRHAVWDVPEELTALGEAADPALSPDGRWLIFVSGTRGLNCELFVAEVVDGLPRDPRPLVELDTPADELAPAFGPGAFYFASDRPGGAGGLDVWRASFVDGRFGSAELLGPGLNSAADETDPAPVPGSREIVFASDRARGDFDLYSAVPDADEVWLPVPLEVLNGPSDEREPAFSDDPRSLTFASARPGGKGAFDLYRALRFQEVWHTPEPVHELSSARSERGPWLSGDGFQLWFACTDENAAGGAVEGTAENTVEGGASTLWHARSREIFRLPTPAITLAQGLMLVALVLLALLALLAKRWHALDILYRCLLVSLLVHLLLMLYLRAVQPEEKRFETGREEGARIRVRLAPPEPDAATQGLSGSLAPRRERFTPAAVRAEAPAIARLAALERAEESAPARREALPSALPPAPTPALLVPAEAFARLASESASLALPASSIWIETPAPTTELERVRSVPAALGAPSPAVAHLVPADAPAADLARGAERSVPLERAGGATPAPALATPGETFEPAQGLAPELALAAPAAPRANPGVPARASSAPSRDQPPTPERPPGELAPGPIVAATTDTPARERLESARDTAPSETGRAKPALRAPSGGEAPPLARPSTSFDATAGLVATMGMRSTRALGTPARVPGDPASAPSATPPPTRGRAAPTPASDLGELEAPVLEPLRAAAGASVLAGTAPRLRAPTGAPKPSPPASRSPRFDAGEGLEPSSASTPSRPAAPGRALAKAPLREPARPEAQPLTLPALAAPAPDALSLERSPPPRLAQTPYQNRFGEQKLRALEEFGGTSETEHAVAAGLSYLARIQDSNGAWGQRSDEHQKYLDVRIGKSALALLAFLGAGHMPGGDGEHADVAERTVRYLLGEQDPASGHFGRSCSYGHGIATYALAECFALTQDARLRTPLERALGEILRHQHGGGDPRFAGGWGYYFADGHVWNRDEWPRTSVTAWQVMALESARLAGLEVPDPAFGAAREFLLHMWDPRARAFRYDHDPERLASGYPILPASTPAALFALSLLGVDTSHEDLAAARRFVLTRMPDGYRYTGDDDFVRAARGNLYFWYYATLALFRVGGLEWERWNSALKETLLPAQDSDGSWRPLDVYAEYAGDEDEERTYTTAMCVLSLEIYYRYFTPLLRVR